MKNISRYIILLTISLLLNTFESYSQTKHEILLFENANKLYSQKKYNEAVTKYQKILEAGYESAELYYNLANSYYRLKKLSHAIYYYEKAKILAPNDEDINANSELAELLVNNKPLPIPEAGIVKFFKNLIIFGNMDFWAVTSVILFFIGLFFTAYFLISKISGIKKIMFTAAIISIFFSILTFYFTIKNYNVINAKNRAVVFSMQAPVNSSPDENSTKLFDAYEGFKVKIDEESGNWYKIILEDGKQGWIKKNTLKIL